MRMVISVGDRRVQVTIAWHRCGGWSSIIAAVIVGGLTGAWRSVLRGDATTGLTTALCDAVTVLRWPAVLVTLVFTVVAVGLDGDDHLDEAHRTVGERLMILRGCQALAGLTMSVLLLGVAILSSGLFGLFGGLREGSPLGPAATASWAALPAGVLAGFAAGLVLLGVVNWSARRVLALAGILLGSFAVAVALITTTWESVAVVHPLAGPWRLVYTGESEALTIPVSRTTAVVLTLVWTAAALVVPAARRAGEHLISRHGARRLRRRTG